MDCMYLRYSFQIKPVCSFGTHFHTKFEQKVLSLKHDLHLASDLAAGHDHNLPVEYGHVGHEGLDRK